MVKASLASLPASAEFVEAASGLEAIERLALGVVDLIVLDLNMPDMHGLEVLGFVRSHLKYRKVPVIVLTTRGDAASRQAALQGGASAYLTKPFVPGALAAEAAQLLSAASARGAAR
jgi:two-component system chemotaxis response regulator CheY